MKRQGMFLATVVCLAGCASSDPPVIGSDVPGFDVLGDDEAGIAPGDPGAEGPLAEAETAQDDVTADEASALDALETVEAAAEGVGDLAGDVGVDVDPGADGSGQEVAAPGPCGCADFFDCASKCASGGQPCVDQCLAVQPATAQTAIGALLKCQKDHSCPPGDPAAMKQCIEQYCLSPYFACFGDACGVTYPTCAGLVACTQACPADNAATLAVNEADVCRTKCMTSASSEADLDLMALQTCLVGACPVCDPEPTTAPEQAQCHACESTASGGTCLSQYSKCAVAGDQPCAKVWACLNGCTGDACGQACAQSGTVAAQAQASKIFGCLAAACPSSSAPSCYPTALQGTCKTLLDSCLADS